ncbi:uncharacterized protein LOC135247427 isoform X4 [Anguilla rostrata]|uniref:uncharacterized protein LOC135247427 isoform X4 n=1 Tax=Anguilla rostrata TaxID=7938 RepID=UPI0030D0074F
MASSCSPLLIDQITGEATLVADMLDEDEICDSAAVLHGKLKDPVTSCEAKNKVSSCDLQMTGEATLVADVLDEDEICDSGEVLHGKLKDSLTSHDAKHKVSSCDLKVTAVTIPTGTDTVDTEMASSSSPHLIDQVTAVAIPSGTDTVDTEMASSCSPLLIDQITGEATLVADMLDEDEICDSAAVLHGKLKDPVTSCEAKNKVSSCATSSGPRDEKRGKNLDQIHIDPEEQIQVQSDMSADEEECESLETEVTASQDQTTGCLLQTAEQSQRQAEKGIEVKPPFKGKGVQKKRRSWVRPEVRAVEKHLMHFIQTYQVPGKDACEACIKAEPLSLKDRNWLAVKFYIKNRITALQRKD